MKVDIAAKERDKLQEELTTTKESVQNLQLELAAAQNDLAKLISDEAATQEEINTCQQQMA